MGCTAADFHAFKPTTDLSAKECGEICTGQDILQPISFKSNLLL